MKHTVSMPSARLMFLRNVAGLCLILTGLSGFSQTQNKDLSPQVTALFEKQVGMDDNLPSEKNPAGLKFQFSKIGDSNLDQGHYVSYRAFVAGAPEDRKYAVAIWKIGSDPVVLHGDVYVNAKGLLMNKKPRPDQESKDWVEGEDEVDIAVQAASGEPVRLILATLDGSFAVPGTIVPYPILARDRKCQLEARLAMRDAEAVLIYADGLTPNSDIPFQTVSAGDTQTGVMHTNANGHAATIDLPYAAGKDSGMLQLAVAAKECAASVTIPWGKGSYHPL